MIEDFVSFKIGADAASVSASANTTVRQLSGSANAKGCANSAPPIATATTLLPKLPFRFFLPMLSLPLLISSATLLSLCIY
jgi:hypothetical protein